jgi:hypothetical protein
MLPSRGIPLFEKRYEWDYKGQYRLYEKAGFIKVSEMDGKAVMRGEFSL